MLKHHFWFAAPLLLTLWLAGCTSAARLPVPPNALRDGSGSTQLAELPPALRTPDMSILYVTDRQPLPRDARGNAYGFGRSPHIRYGRAVVSLGGELQWEDLVRYSGSSRPRGQYRMRVTRVEEIGEILPDVMHLQDAGAGVTLDSEAQRREDARLQATISTALAATPHRDVYIYIHGFGNAFDHAVLRASAIWHYVGRRGVALCYTWPAGRGGPLGYFYDRESGEFTVYHLKRTLRAIAGCPDVERVHIIAHSRGTDVALAALRELNGEYRGAAVNPSVALKIRTVVLAAPDLDLDVFGQRFGSENLIALADQTVVYTAREDSALAVARWLFGGRGRLGGANLAHSDPQTMQQISRLSGLQLISTNVKGYSSSHAYVFSNPAAMSDLILVLRDHALAGAEHGRPLTRHVGWWFLDDSYFADRARGN